jgi:predicted transcriptional regulator
MTVIPGEADVIERGIGDLEAVVMDRIWQRDGKVSVRDIFDELSSTRSIAYTTVMSTMDNLYRKEWLTRERVGKAYLYWPTMSREERSARLMRAALASGGDSNLVLTHFLEAISDDESARLHEALRRMSKRGKK